MSHTLCIVIPAHNEGRTIGTVVSKCLNFTPNVLVVDDGSLDNTGSLASAAGAKVLRTAQRGGYGSALRLGFDHCKKSRCDTIITLDGDGAHDPQFVPAMIESHLRNQAQVTIGSRFINPRLSEHIPDAKVAANFFATALFNSATGSAFTDVASGMRALDKSTLDLECEAATFGFTYKYLEAALRRGMKIVETGISVHYNAEKLLCTNHGELTDFLLSVVCTTNKDNSRLRRALDAICEVVAARRVLHVFADGRYVIAQPIPQIDAYLFQFQDPCFVGENTREKWIDWNQNEEEHE